MTKSSLASLVSMFVGFSEAERLKESSSMAESPSAGAQMLQFNSHKSESQCEDVVVKVHTERWANLMEWNVGNCRVDNPDYWNNREYEQRCCIKPGDILTCKSDGTGWMGGFLEINGEQYCGRPQGVKFSEMQEAVGVSHDFGNKAVGKQCKRSPEITYTLADGNDGWPTTSLSMCMLKCKNDPKCSYVVWQDYGSEIFKSPGWCQLATGSCGWEVAASNSQVWTKTSVQSPMPENKCEYVGVTLHTETYASEIAWELGNCNMESGQYKDGAEYKTNCCIKPEDLLICKDTYGDGWHGGYIEIKGERFCAQNFGRDMSEAVGIFANFGNHLPGQRCDRSPQITYTLADGNNGWPRTSLSMCMWKCKNDPKCDFVSWSDHPSFPPGWCQLATGSCHPAVSGSHNHVWQKLN